MDIDRVLEGISYGYRQISYWQAQVFRGLAEYAELCDGDEFRDEEIAALLKWTSSWASAQIAMARDVVGRLPRAVDALEKGEIDPYKVKALHEHTMALTPEQAAEVEEVVLVRAPEQTGAQMRRTSLRAVMKVDPEGHAQRAALRKQRCTGIDAMEQDMARLWAFLPAEKALACALRVNKIARQTKSAGDDRTLDQVRADVVADLLLATPDQSSAVQVQLYVAVSAATVMGLSEQPGELSGYGPISADLARELAADATWRRILTDPVTGAAQEVGSRSYRPPAALRKFLWARDRTCRMPGCMRPAEESEIDHTVPFPVGQTTSNNTGAFCKRHHRCKHRSGWQVTQPKPGRFTFVSPAGRVYHRDPEPVLGDLPPF